MKMIDTILNELALHNNVSSQMGKLSTQIESFAKLAI